MISADVFTSEPINQPCLIKDIFTPNSYLQHRNLRVFIPHLEPAQRRLYYTEADMRFAHTHKCTHTKTNSRTK